MRWTLQKQALVAVGVVLCSALLYVPGARAAVDEAAAVGRVSGLRGDARLIGGGSAPSYELPEGTTLQSGTVEFWFSPHDWDNRMVYDLNGHQFIVPLIRGVGVQPGADSESTTFMLAAFRMSESKANAPNGLWVRYALQPGSWYHVLLTWRGRSYRLYVNGEPADSWTFRLVAGRVDPGSTLHRLEFGGGKWWLEYRKASGWMMYGGQKTLVDEFRYYSRDLTPPEVANAYRRYLPDGTLTKLQFADAAVSMNAHTKRLGASLELLSPDREQIDHVRFRLTRDGAPVMVDTNMPPLDDGRTALALHHPDVGYGAYTGRFTFVASDGRSIDEQVLSVDRPPPAWYGNTLGIHEGEVLPGWEPMRVEGHVIRCLGKEIELDGSGWPIRLAARGENVQDAPPRITLESDAGPVALAAVANGPEIVLQRDDLVETSGVAEGDGWRLTTEISTEFDGFMLVKATLSGPAARTVRTFRLDVPLRLAPEQFVGFWAGNRWFRGACDYRRLPSRDGAVFTSNATGRGQPEGWKDRVSFLPFLSVSDDWRGLFWLAENDRNWSQGWEHPAQEVIREGERTWLRLNFVHEGQPKVMTEPRTYVFGMQTMPVRPPPAKPRALARQVSFGAVDGFNGCTITAEIGGHMEFRLSPQDLDWSVVPKKVERGRRVSPSKELYMYLDRCWQRAPEDAHEYNGDWRGWGGATRYTRPVRDAFAWYMNEYIRQGFIQGVYIDDCWTKPTKVTGHGPAYRREDGETEWGFEFFDYRRTLKRLRWLFYDNGVEPLIWCHVTQTLYYPVFAFVDIFVDGEDRYLAWGDKRDFITCWGLDRIRYSNIAKSGIPTVWLNSIGNKMIPKGPMAKWRFRQQRAYVGDCAVSDVWTCDDASGRPRADLIRLGAASDNAEFIGYWDPRNPVHSDTNAVVASVYRLPGHVGLVILNQGRTSCVPSLRVDEPAICEWLGVSAGLAYEDADAYDMPEQDDIQDWIADSRNMTVAPDVTMEDEDPMIVEAMQALTETIQEEERLEDDPLAFYDAHNLTVEDGLLRLRVRPHDYRLVKIRAAAEEVAP